MSVAEAAEAWRSAGVCTIPILPGGNKKPAIQWGKYQIQLPVETELSEWFGNGHPYGLALLMGKISGGMEMTEIEGRAVDRMSDLGHACDAAGIGDLWNRLLIGYAETSPTGGVHFIYRVTGMDVPGNKKIASRPATAEELEVRSDDRIKVLAETRGEGGYVVVAPTDGVCHTSGRPWEKWHGSAYGVVETITAEERDAFHAVLREVLHQEPYTEPRLPVPAIPLAAFPVERGAGSELRPGDAFEAYDWRDDLLLGGAGWQVTRVIGGTTYWTRPGKDSRDGISATTGHDGQRDRLYVFSTSTIFPTEEPITKFRAYSLLHHGGNDSTAASRLRELGWGGERQLPIPTGFQFDDPIEEFSLTDTGNAALLRRELKDLVRWVEAESQFYCYCDGRWAPCTPGYVERAAARVAARLAASNDDATRKWGNRSRGIGAIRASRDSLKRDVEAMPEDFDLDKHLLNLENGTLDLRTGEFREHRPEDMITRKFCASYDPEATAPKFQAFLDLVLPDRELQGYVQRAIGSSLLPLAGRRAIFLLHGPSGTAKSQFTELFQHLFCKYGATAPASAFRHKRDSSATNDLHCLKGKRFVATSETSDSAAFDEEILKRLTGGDTMRTRELYQGFQDWIPECSIWIATNFPPRFTSDDNAVWKRAKLIPFHTVIDATEVIPDYARTALVPEASGILNWMLAGLREYLENGLQEPDSVGLAVNTMRAENDSVAQFVEEQVNDGLLELGDPNDPLFDIPAKDLYVSYQMWATANGERPLVRRRFTNRLTLLSQPLLSQKSGGQMRVTGIRRPPGVSVLGSFREKILE